MAADEKQGSALMKRDEQKKRWEDSDTNLEPVIPKRKQTKVNFQDGCVFLAACSSGDTAEVEKILRSERRADINTANVDGLTALHQACIDDNLEMVEFLVEHGADIDVCDNEGWTPLHATASCAFLDIARYLINHNANVAAVNNDGDLPIDIAENEDMENLLQEEMDRRGIDAEVARCEEEQRMLEDANLWLSHKIVKEIQHPKTGATALHVAAAKGYIKVIKLLLEAGVDINAEDYDGWTPLHAAAHWGQEEACEILVENMCDMSHKNKAGHTAFDIAENDMLTMLQELKEKQASIKNKQERDMDIILSSDYGGQRRSSGSITRMSGGQKQNVMHRTSEEERTALSSHHPEKTDDKILSSISLAEDHRNDKIKQIPQQSQLPVTTADRTSTTSADRTSITSGVRTSTTTAWSGTTSVDTSASLVERKQLPSRINSATGVELRQPSSVSTSNFGIATSTESVATSTQGIATSIQGVATCTQGVATSTQGVAATTQGVATSTQDVATSRQGVATSTQGAATSTQGAATSTQGAATSTQGAATSTQGAATSTQGAVTSTQGVATSTQGAATSTQGVATSTQGAATSTQGVATSTQGAVTSTQGVATSTQGAATSTQGAATSTQGAATSTQGIELRRLSSIVTSTPSKVLQRPASVATSAPVVELCFSNNVANSTPGVELRRPAIVITSTNSDTSRIIEGPEVICPAPISVTSAPTTATTVPTAPSTSTILPPTTGTGADAVLSSRSSLIASKVDRVSYPNDTSVQESMTHDRLASSRPITSITTTASATTKTTDADARSFEPPKRDEDTETQRKARAKHARQTRRPTQGVSLEDLEKAEESLNRDKDSSGTSASSRLSSAIRRETAAIGNGETSNSTVIPTARTTTNVTSDPGLKEDRSITSGYKRWSTEDKNEPMDAPSTRGSFRKSREDRDLNSSKGVPDVTTNYIPRSQRTSAVQPGDTVATSIQSMLRPTLTSRQSDQAPSKPEEESKKNESSSTEEKKEGKKESTSLRARRQRKERRPTGIEVDGEDGTSKDKRSEEDKDDDTQDSAQDSNSESQRTISSTEVSKPAGYLDIDYKKKYEDEKSENERIRKDLEKTKKEFQEVKTELDRTNRQKENSRNSDRDKRALEKKLSEMEEELKKIESLKTDNQRLKDENGALIRVISKLSK